MTIELGGTSLQEGVMDGLTLLEVWVGDQIIWSATVQITLGTGTEARDQLQAALTDRGLNYQTVEEIPFDIELVGTGSVEYMFYDYFALTSVPAMDTSNVTNMDSTFSNCLSLTSVPDLDTSNVTNMGYMFSGSSSLTHVPDLDTAQVTNMAWMFYYCAALTDGNVRLSLLRQGANTISMIRDSGLTSEPFGAYEVSTSGRGNQVVHPLVSVTVPAGQVWDVQIEGTVTLAPSEHYDRPRFRVGSSTSTYFSQGASVNFSGTVSSSNATIAMVTNTSLRDATFTGTVTIRK